jgi:hypothetical protein
MDNFNSSKGFSISDLPFSSSAKPLGVIPSALWEKTENDEMRKKLRVCCDFS